MRGQLCIIYIAYDNEVKLQPNACNRSQRCIEEGLHGQDASHIGTLMTYTYQASEGPVSYPTSKDA